MVNGVRIAALALVVVAAVFNIVGVATNYWVKKTVSGTKIHGGLWRGCFGDSCGDIKGSDVDSKLEAARAFTIIPLLMAVGSGILLGLSNRPQIIGERNYLPLIAMGLLIVQAIFLAIGAGVGWKFFDDQGSKINISYNVDYSLALTAVACVMYFITAILAGVSTRMETA